VDVILLQKVANLGQIGDRVKVKPGYARNFLVPTGKATMATPANIAKFEAQRVQLEAKARDDLAAAQTRAAQFENFKLELKAKAGTEGKLFGSIGTADIAEAAVQAGHPVSRSEVRMPNGPIRSIGEHQVQLHLHADVDVSLAVTITAEE
jgi:large subunit ribosomal protein L9